MTAGCWKQNPGWASLSVAVMAVTVLSAMLATPAQAQVYIGPGDAPRKGSVEVGGGFLWTGGFDLGDSAALLTDPDNNDQTSFTLFATDTRMRASNGVQGRVAFYLTPALAVEGGVQYSRPVLAARITDDAEDAEDVTAEDSITRYVVDGSLIYHLRTLSFAGGRGIPFVSAGAGYLRELHEADQLVETGAEYHAGAGIKFLLTRGRRSVGVRGDLGVTVRDGGFDFEDGRRFLPAAGASLIYLF